MSLQQQLDDDLKTAMKAGEKARVGVLRMLRAEMTNARIERGHALDEAEILDVLTRPVVDVSANLDPHDANKGDQLAGGLRVERRLGTGGTALVLQSSRPEIEPFPGVAQIFAGIFVRSFAARLRSKA